jgi:uncharacterized membrane protein
MSFKNKLALHANRWEEKKIITAKQKAAIIEEVAWESSGAGFLKILGTIWALLIGAGVLLIIAGNWSGFPKILQLIMALALPIVSLWLGYYFSYIQVELRKIGQAFALLGWVMIGANVALIGQIYNTDGTVGWLLLIWLIMLLPVLYVFKVKTLAVLATGLFYWVCYYYLFEVIFTSWRDEEYVIAAFTFISAGITLLAYLWNKATKELYNYMLYPVALISLKILFFVLFLAAIWDDGWFNFMFLADWFAGILLHNVIFLGTIFACMWWANKNSEILLRHATFVWFGLWFAWKYFELVGSYMQGGMFFVMSGIVLMWIVYTLVKINKKLSN